MLVGLHHARREDALRAVEGGEGLAQLAHVPADRGLLLDEDDLVAAVRDVEGGLDAGDAAADDEGAFGNRDGDGREDAVFLDPLDHHGDDFDGFGCGFFDVFVDPGAVFADVGHFAKERV